MALEDNSVGDQMTTNDILVIFSTDDECISIIIIQFGSESVIYYSLIIALYEVEG